MVSVLVVKCERLIRLSTFMLHLIRGVLCSADKQGMSIDIFLIAIIDLGRR